MFSKGSVHIKTDIDSRTGWYRQSGSIIEKRIQNCPARHEHVGVATGGVVRLANFVGRARSIDTKDSVASSGRQYLNAGTGTGDIKKLNLLANLI